MIKRILRKMFASAATKAQIHDAITPSWGLQGRLEEEERIEAAYWRYDAKHKGYNEWKLAPMSEREAFKTEMRSALAGEKVRAQMRLVANGWRQP